MGELTTRPYIDADAPAVTELFNAIEIHAGGHPYMTTDEIRALTLTVRDPQADSRLVFGPGGELAAMACVPTPPAGGFRVDMFGGVAPGWRGRGIGRDLLAWQLDRVARLHGEVAPERDWEAHFGTNAEDTDALRVYRRFDLSAVRYWFEMVAPTAAAPQAHVPDGLDVGEYRPELETALYDAHMEAFADHWGFQRRDLAAWLPLTVRSADFLAGLSRIATAAGEVAGYVLTYRSPEPGRAYVGQVGVRRPWRSRGLAGAMLAEVLTACAGTGFEVVNLGVDADSPTGAVGVYERVGFSVESRGVTYATALPAARPATRRPS